MKNIYLQLLDLLPANPRLGLATVTKTVGSTPQKPGSSAIFNVTGLLSGTVGGGLVEGKIQQFAINSILTKESGYYEFNLNREITNGEDALCGGKIDILVDASPLDHIEALKQLRQSLEKRIPGVLATVVSNGTTDKAKIQRYWITADSVFPPVLNDSVKKEVQKLLTQSHSENNIDYKEFTETGNSLFLEFIAPPPHLIIAGAGHIGKALSHIARLLDFEVSVIDDRSEYANADNLPDADYLIVDDVGQAIEEMKIESDTYVVIVTRGHKDDSKALRACIGSDAAYIGMIGSKNKVAQLREEFIKKGWAEPREWKDIHAPIGLDIHSKSVQEIAVSIAAELIQVKNAGKQ